MNLVSCDRIWYPVTGKGDTSYIFRYKFIEMTLKSRGLTPKGADK